MKKNTYYFIGNFENSNIRLELSTEITATELVEHFLDFCVGSGYHKDSIIDAMADIAALESE